MGKTIDYYNNNAYQFAKGTKDVDFSDIQKKFLSYLSVGDKILDFGCGSGRDTKFFLDNGFFVDAVDGSEELCKLASEFAGIQVQKMFFSELNCTDVYDGIWACASILHVPMGQLPDIFRRMINAIHDDGIIYTSFKYGTGEIKRGERFFSDFTEKTMNSFLTQFPELQTREMWVTTDVRPGRGEEKWLNLIFQKSILS